MVSEHLCIAAVERHPLMVLDQSKLLTVNAVGSPLVWRADADVRIWRCRLVPVHQGERLHGQCGVTDHDELLHHTGAGQVLGLIQGVLDHLHVRIDQVGPTLGEDRGHKPELEQLQHVVPLAGVVVSAMCPSHVAALQRILKKPAPDARVLQMVLELEHEVDDTWPEQAPCGWCFWSTLLCGRGLAEEAPQRRRNRGMGKAKQRHQRQ
mmetsp:Transcript_75898/g.176002  ORF Transcript_75898/g.176002 Transcript_75898/m.176002 type:complete len:208 (+) Transcript_75898:630-1253(+)